MNIRFLYTSVTLLSFIFSNAQNFSGQWKGEFIDKSSAVGNFSGDKCTYVLELEADGKNVSGSSYTYFTEGGKRYYTICKVEGWIDTKRKYIEVVETSRTKTNIPSNIRNCFQTHKLTYFKKGEEETLEGNWIPAPNQGGGCGFGNTSLSKRLLNNSFTNKNNKDKENEKSKKKNEDGKKDNDVVKLTRKPFKKQKVQETKTEDVPDDKDVTSTTEKRKPADNIIKESKSDVDSDTEETRKLEKRKPTLVKTIEIENNHIDVDFYDNGEIDGDTVSVFYNNKLILSKRRLTDRPLHMVLDMDDDVEVNELVMYAENLGSIPPNSAVMIVRDGPNRYEVRVSSDLNNSGVIRFKHKRQTQ